MKEARIESRRFIIFLLILSAGFLLSSCGGPIDCPESYQPYFQYSDSVVPNSIYLQLKQGEWTSIDVAATTITDSVSSMSFDLDFDSTIMVYDGYLAGEFLEQNGRQVSYTVNLDPMNDHKLIVNISQEGTGSGATGSGVIVTLKIKLIAEGTSSISFSKNHLFGSSGQELTIDGWTGADIIISRVMCD